MTAVSTDKQYQTRDGRPARILSATRLDPAFPVVASIADKEIEAVYFYTREGCSRLDGTPHPCDLIELPPYSDFKKDEPVWVRNYGDFTWVKRHFSHVQRGVAYTFAAGDSSWTSPISPDGRLSVTRWDLCRRPTPEELG